MNIAQVKTRRGNYPESLEIYFEALSVAEEVGNLASMSGAAATEITSLLENSKKI